MGKLRYPYEAPVRRTKLDWADKLVFWLIDKVLKVTQ